MLWPSRISELYFKQIDVTQYVLPLFLNTAETILFHTQPIVAFFSFWILHKNVLLSLFPAADVDGYDDRVLSFFLHYFGESEKLPACY